MRRPSGRLRVIGGAWRSRLIDFDPDTGVRPTPDRVRQTLFDWLAPRIVGTRCLDLFAGSGALGFEALSRGAASVLFCERGASQLESLRAAVARLGADDRCRIVAGDALGMLDTVAAGEFDLVFLDPPYDADLLPEVLPRLAASLAPDNRVYLEWRGERRPQLPCGFSWLKEKSAGQVSYGLVDYFGAGK